MHVSGVDKCLNLIELIAHECFEQAVIKCIAQFFEHRELRWIESRFNTSRKKTVWDCWYLQMHNQPILYTHFICTFMLFTWFCDIYF